MVTAFSVPEGREKYYDSDAVSCLANLSNLTQAEKSRIIAMRADREVGTPRDNEKNSSNASDEYRKLVEFIRMEKPYFRSDINPIDLFKPYYVHPKMSNRRILSQAGGFIIYGLDSPRRIRFAHQIDEMRFIIPMKSKAKLRKELELLGITESTLFPEIDKAAKRIEARYSTGVDES